MNFSLLFDWVYELQIVVQVLRVLPQMPTVHTSYMKLTLRDAGKLIDAQHRNQDYTPWDLQWIGGTQSRMSAQIKSRKYPGLTETCHLRRVQDAPNGRVKVKCTCKYVQMDGFCDHAILMCDLGQAAHAHELFERIE
jgi:hypothetical protein